MSKFSTRGRVPLHQIVDGITPKQAKFVSHIAEGKSGTEAALLAYNTESLGTAQVISSENLKKPMVRSAIDKAIGTLDLTAIKALMPIKEALEHDDLEMRLKGTDRWIKLIPRDKPEGSSMTVNFNLGSKSYKADS
jgi:phage terminase small subunit